MILYVPRHVVRVNKYIISYLILVPQVAPSSGSVFMQSESRPTRHPATIRIIQVPLISISRIHTKRLSDCRKIKDQSNPPHSVRCCNISVRPWHRRSQDFCLGRAPGRRHPALYQSCTRLKMSREAGDLSALQQSEELGVEPKRGKK